MSQQLLVPGRTYRVKEAPEIPINGKEPPKEDFIPRGSFTLLGPDGDEIAVMCQGIHVAPKEEHGGEIRTIWGLAPTLAGMRGFVGRIHPGLRKGLSFLVRE
ncbi:MAG: hypothetical protein Q7K38_00645 [Candidatus Wildermuthbacteria bacterium]|nr:hypothetical protein [Candidatus Wildermuthbacteria bacterium]